MVQVGRVRQRSFRNFPFGCLLVGNHARIRPCIAHFHEREIAPGAIQTGRFLARSTGIEDAVLPRCEDSTEQDHNGNASKGQIMSLHDVGFPYNILNPIAAGKP